ncbi:HDOD domain-containing protein [Accumulibacter sp.]|uniref:HDOD domain-containing protein n=1 Tax=Accumulibacter sp. TaxID=2053492 RepID=UPI0026059B5E|nr:HDOD domain-containing protein [Accumulibacter sp.]
MSNNPHPQNLADWLMLLGDRELPILRQTARRLEKARQQIDRVTGRDITDIVLQDPLLAVRVVALIQSFGSKHLRSEITNIASAVMMLGVEPFFRAFENPLTIESVLGQQPQALLGMLQVVLRTQRASRYAYEWAFARHDMSVDEVALAALLHDLAEILLWCFAPDLAIEIRARLHADRNLRSASAQQEVLGFTLAELQISLCHAWHLPALLTTLMDDRKAQLPRVQNVRLAVDLARHSVDGWGDAAIPDDLEAIQALLKINRETLLARLQLPPELLPLPARGEPGAATPRGQRSG